MYCFPRRYCFYEPVHGLHCFTTYHCIPPFPRNLIHSIPQEMTTWGLKSPYTNCIDQEEYKNIYPPHY